MRPDETLSAAELRVATGLYVTEIENLLSRENRQWVLMESAVPAKDGEARQR